MRAEMASLLERFLRYVKIDSQSKDGRDCTPSSDGQRVLAELLAEEMRALGLKEVSVDRHAYVIARLPGRNVAADAPCIGLIAHLDTALESSGAGVNPNVIENYDGGPIELGNDLHLSPSTFPVLMEKVGKTLVTTDGRTLLGADDKAGIAIIMTVLEELLNHPDMAYPSIAVAFTPDEEIGHGAELLDLDVFGADFAYTIDGGGLGTIEYENFNAAKAVVEIRGLAIHPGEAKDRMVNAVLLGQSFLEALPTNERPETTELRQGFYHVDSFEADVVAAHLSLLVRDHDAASFQARKNFLQELIERLNIRWAVPDGETPRFTLTITDQYRNMLEMILPCINIVENAKAAMRQLGLEPTENPIRGGTDGARLSWRGLPCPNLFDGGYNMHSPYEFAVVEEMRLAVDTILDVLTHYSG